MSAYFHSYQNTASSILDAYSYREPFTFFLKKYFRKFKKFGSRDRKIIADLCFGYFRIGQSALNYSVQDQLIIGYYLTHQFDRGYLEMFSPSLSSSIDREIADKIKLLNTQYPDFDYHKIFPCQDQLSTGIDKDLFAINHIKKPAFFIRVRPGKKDKVLEVLAKNVVKFQSVTDSCLKLFGNVNIEELLDIDSDCVVQDYGSQQTFDVLTGVAFPKYLSIWDACAGSGGKSIMARDIFPQAKLYVSDIREDILEELEYRFKLAHIVPEKVFCTDLQHPLSSQVSISNLPNGGVDMIIADVPCTGSGTWGRSPEWLRSFDETLIDSYRQRQTSIVSRLPEQLKPGGYLLYITCSVFYQENESLVDFIQQTTKLKLVKQELVSGTNSESDTLFTALFILQA